MSDVKKEEKTQPLLNEEKNHPLLSEELNEEYKIFIASVNLDKKQKVFLKDFISKVIEEGEQFGINRCKYVT